MCVCVAGTWCTGCVSVTLCVCVLHTVHTGTRTTMCPPWSGSWRCTHAARGHTRLTHMHVHSHHCILHTQHCGVSTVCGRYRRAAHSARGQLQTGRRRTRARARRWRVRWECEHVEAALGAPAIGRARGVAAPPPHFVRGDPAAHLPLPQRHGAAQEGAVPAAPGRRARGNPAAAAKARRL